MWSFPMPTFSPGNHFVPMREVLVFNQVWLCSKPYLPLCLKIIFPGWTHSEEPFFAPNLLPAESVGPFARPCWAWEAWRTKIVEVRGWRGVCFEQRANEFKDDARAASEASEPATGLYIRGWSILFVMAV